MGWKNKKTKNMFLWIIPVSGFIFICVISQSLLVPTVFLNLNNYSYLLAFYAGAYFVFLALFVAILVIYMRHLVKHFPKSKNKIGFVLLNLIIFLILILFTFFFLIRLKGSIQDFFVGVEEVSIEQCEFYKRDSGRRSLAITEVCTDINGCYQINMSTYSKGVLLNSGNSCLGRNRLIILKNSRIVLDIYK